MSSPSKDGLRAQNKETVFQHRSHAPSIALLIEDNVVNQLVAKEYLKHYGVPVVRICSTLQEAKAELGRSDEDAYPLIIFDVMLPDGESLALFQQCRQARKNAVMGFYTARTGVDEFELYKALGADFILCKPLTMEEMFHQLDTSLS